MSTATLRSATLTSSFCCFASLSWGETRANEAASASSTGQRRSAPHESRYDSEPVVHAPVSMPDDTPDRLRRWPSFSRRLDLSSSRRRCQLRCSRRKGVHIRTHTGARTLVARLQVGMRGKYVCNSSHLRSLSASLSHLGKLTGPGLTKQLADGNADGYQPPANSGPTACQSGIKEHPKVTTTTAVKASLSTVRHG